MAYVLFIMRRHRPFLSHRLSRCITVLDVGQEEMFITFVMEYENYTFARGTAASGRQGGSAASKDRMIRREAREKAEKRATLLEINKLAASYFYYQLRRENGSQAYAYLINRGVSEDTIKKFGLGYSDKYSDDLYKFLKSKELQR